jgi:iron complex transport system permease protein
MSRTGIVLAVVLVVLAALFVVSLLVGQVWLDPREVWHELFQPKPGLAALIVTELRLPRTVLACLVGLSLGLSGAVLQGLTRNPLAEPGLLGVSAGAALGAVIAIYFGMTALFEITGPVMGLIGALCASALTFALGRRGGTIALILAGAAVSGLAGACISLALNLAPSPYAAYEIMTWLMGSLTDRSWNHVLIVLPFVAVGCAMLAFTARALDALSLGETQAQSLGIDLDRLRILVILGTALAVGAVTSVTGAIGFVGLVAPHAIRPFVGHQPSRILLPAALMGAVLLLAADIGTRVIHVGPELKIGVVTSLIGTPFFFWLVVRLRRTAP